MDGTFDSSENEAAGESSLISLPGEDGQTLATTPTYPTQHPRIYLTPHRARLQAALAQGTPAASRFRTRVDQWLGGADGSYEQPFDDTANVIGLVPGSDPAVGSEIILVGAHHDHLGDGMLGANDNASGVAALLAVAQAVQRQGAPRRTIAFVTYGAEERGLVGSLHLVAHPPAALPLDRIVQVINLDMIGSHSSANAVYAFGAFPKLPALAILAELGRKHPKLNVSLGGHSVRGDHLGFCRKGIPYVFFWTPDRRCYHERCDTAERLDYPRMADIAQLAGGLASRLAGTDVDLAAAKARAGCGAK